MEITKVKTYKHSRRKAPKFSSNMTFKERRKILITKTMALLAFIQILSVSVFADPNPNPVPKPNPNPNPNPALTYHTGYGSHIEQDLSCDFESNQKHKELCNFKQELTDDSDWIKEIVDNETVLSFSTLNNRIGEVARLYGKKITLQESHCVKFRYKIISESKKYRRDGSSSSSSPLSSSQISDNSKWTDQMSSVQLSVFVVEDTDWAYQNPIWSSSSPSLNHDDFETIELSLVPDRYHLVFEARVLSENLPYKIYLDDIRVERRRCNRAPHFLRLASLEMNRGQSGAFSCKLTDHQLVKYLPSSQLSSSERAVGQSSLGSSDLDGNTSNKNKLSLRLEMSGGGKFIRPDSLPMTLDYETIEARFSFSEATSQISGRYRCVVKEPNVSAVSNYAGLKVKVPPSPLFAPQVVTAGATHLIIALKTEKYRGDGPIISTNLQYQPVGGKWSDTHPIILNSRNSNMKKRAIMSDTVTAGFDSTNKTTYKLWNLLPDTEYEFRVLLSRPYAGGQGAPGPTLKTKTKCDIPAKSIKNIQSQSLGPDRISLVWDKPLPSAARCQSYTYEVRYRPRDTSKANTDEFQKLKIENSDQLGIELNNLTPYVEYELYVYIINSAGQRQSNAVYVKTDESVPGVIQRNTFKARAHPSGEELNLFWKRPQISNGELKQYQIAYEATESWIENSKTFLYQTETVEISSDLESTTLINLYPGTIYKISIRAATKKGFGPVTSIHQRTSIGPPRMPKYKDDKNLPVVEVQRNGRVLLALHAAKSNGAPIDKYQVIVEKKDSSRQKRAIINTGEADSCPHVTKFRYGEHLTSNYWVAAEISHREFQANQDIVKFILGDNSTKYSYFNPQLTIGKFDIWFYSITKIMSKLPEGRPVENCLKLATVKIENEASLLPMVTAMYRASEDTIYPSWPNYKNPPLTGKNNNLDNDSETSALSISSILILAVLLALFLLTVGVMYAVFIQRKKSDLPNSNQNNQNNRDSAAYTPGHKSTGYNNGAINSPTHIDSDSLKYQKMNSQILLGSNAHTSSSHKAKPQGMDSDYHVNTTLNSNNSNEMFDVKMYPDGRIEQSRTQTQQNSSINNHNMSIDHIRSHDSSPFALPDKHALNQSPPGYDDSGYPASLSRKGPIGDTIASVTNLQNSLTRTPTPNNQKVNPNIAHLNNSQTNNTSGVQTGTPGFNTPPIFLSGTLQSNTSSFAQKLTSQNNTSIRVEDFPIAVNQMKSSSVSGFNADFNSISNFEGSSETAVRSENKGKNRDNSVLPFDHSRVRLKGTATGVLTNDYINASYIEGFKTPAYYIATQAPLDTTVIDFWDMVWHEGSRVIVMVREGFFVILVNWIHGPKKNKMLICTIFCNNFFDMSTRHFQENNRCYSPST